MANKAPNAVVDNLIASVSKFIGGNLSDIMEAEVISLEMLKREIEDTNKRILSEWMREVKKFLWMREKKKKGIRGKIVLFRIDVAA